MPPLGDASLAPGRSLGAYTICQPLERTGVALAFVACRFGSAETFELRCLRQRDAGTPLPAPIEFANVFRRMRSIEAPEKAVGLVPRALDGGVRNGVYWLATEYIDGVQLPRVLPGPAPILEAVTVALAVADALRLAAEFGVHHGDLKPENIVVTAIEGGGLDYVVQVIDTGCVELLGIGSTTITAWPRYRAPEQFPGRCVDPRSDIYSLGAILCDLLHTTADAGAAAPPLDGRSFAERTVPAEVFARWPERLQRLLRTATAERMDDRFPSWEHAVRGERGFALCLPALVEDDEIARQQAAVDRQRERRFAEDRHFVCSTPEALNRSGFRLLSPLRDAIEGAAEQLGSAEHTDPLAPLPPRWAVPPRRERSGPAGGEVREAARETPEQGQGRAGMPREGAGREPALMARSVAEAGQEERVVARPAAPSPLASVKARARLSAGRALLLVLGPAVTIGAAMGLLAVSLAPRSLVQAVASAPCLHTPASVVLVESVAASRTPASPPIPEPAALARQPEAAPARASNALRRGAASRAGSSEPCAPILHCARSRGR